MRSVLLPCALGCREEIRGLPPAISDKPMEEHAVLAGSFVSGDSAALKALLHSDLLVQPPRPDTAQRGSTARSYLLALAANTKLAESRLYPQMVVPEGPFAFEQGIWEVRTGDRVLQSPYVLRWRSTPAGWRIVLWRWGTFH
jgi:hypothetical protein